MEAPFTIQWVQIIGYKKYAAAILDLNKETFIIHIVFLYPGSKISVYLAQKSQIALLIAKKIAILTKYSDYTNIFFKNLVKELCKYFTINKHSIDLELGK